ncbi:hypothetical protein [Pleomorphochaeta sp. DL1XJH-081]|uniref:hypothetical protein n=1 Tax=Pleomorphochaeta sp. DL1XJH-081 TaxID=3409690 RepID=UPI003BB4BEEB
MKKISAVLLVLVLVGSVAFAGFTGEAEANFGIDFDSQQYGFENVVELTSDLVFFEKLVDNAGDGDIYAEIKAELTLAFDFEDQANENDAFADGEIVSNAEITSAKIIGDDWYVGILGAMGAPNFASSAIDIDTTADEDALDLEPADYVVEGAGVEVGYAGYVFGVAAPRDATNDIDAETYNLFGSVTTPEYELGDGLALSFGAAGMLKDTDKAASFSMKGAYTMDDITANIESDLVYDDGLEVEVAVNTVIDIVTLDVYFATLDDAASAAYDDGTENILSAKAAFAIDQFDIEVTGKDLLNASILGASVDFAATEEISVNVNGGYTLMGVNEQAWYVGGGATYTAEKYVASAEATYASDETLEVEASVESDVIVDGATLSLTYASDDIMTLGGSLIAAVNIAF